MQLQQVREYFEIPEMLINLYTCDIYIPNKNKDKVILSNKYNIPRIYDVEYIPNYNRSVYGIRTAKTINKCIFEDKYENILYYKKYNKKTYNIEYTSFAAFPIDKINKKYTHIFANVEFDNKNKEFKLSNKYLIEIDRINACIDHKEGVTSFPFDNPYIRVYTRNYETTHNRVLIYSYGFKINIYDIEKKGHIFSDTLDIFNANKIFNKLSQIDISLKYSLNAILYSYNKSFDNFIYEYIEKKFRNEFYRSLDIIGDDMFYVIEKNIKDTIIPERIYINKLEFVLYDNAEHSDIISSRDGIFKMLNIEHVNNHIRRDLYTLYNVDHNDDVETLLIPNNEFIEYLIENYINVDVLKETIYEAIKEEPILNYTLGIVEYMSDIRDYNVSIEDIDHEIMRRYIKMNLISINTTPKSLFLNEAIKDKFISKLYNFMENLPSNIIDIRKTIGDIEFTHKKIINMFGYIGYKQEYKKLMNITDDNINDTITIKEVYNKLLDTDDLDKDEKDELMEGLERLFKYNITITIKYILNGHEAEINNMGISPTYEDNSITHLLF